MRYLWLLLIFLAFGCYAQEHNEQKANQPLSRNQTTLPDPSLGSIIKKQDSLRELKIISEQEDLLYRMANECWYDTNEIDEFTSKRRIILTRLPITGPESNYVHVGLRRQGNNKVVVFYTGNELGCASPYKHDRSKALVKLENGDILTFYHFDDVDCGDFILYGKILPSEEKRLLKSPIKTIRLQGTKYYYDYNNIEYNSFFIDKLKCIK